MTSATSNAVAVAAATVATTPPATTTTITTTSTTTTITKTPPVQRHIAITTTTTTTNKRGVSTFMYACQQGNVERVRRILQTEPFSVKFHDRSGKSPLDYCCTSSEGVKAAHVADILVMAAPELVDNRDEDGFTPLHLAVIAGNLPLVTFLLANGADVNAVDNEKHTVVHWATVCGETTALRAVLAAGAPVSTPDVHGGYPLHYAAQMCGGEKDPGLGLQVLQTLLAHQGIQVSVEDGDGRQPLLWAASAGSARALLALIRAGAQVESADRDGLTALHCAASRGHTDCIDNLLTLCGASPDVIDSNGCTALHYAVTLGHADATALLLAHGADCNRQDRRGRSPAHCGCAKGQFETVKMIGARGANLWLRNARGDLPLHEAASSGRRDLVKWLLEMRPSQVNARNNDGRCPLHLAALNDNSDMCKILLDAGAQVNPILRTSKNTFMTPLDCALQRGFRSTAKYLQLHGGVPASRLEHSRIKPDSGMNLQIRDDVTFYGDTSSESENEKPVSAKNKDKIHRRTNRRKMLHRNEKKRSSQSGSDLESAKIARENLDTTKNRKQQHKVIGNHKKNNSNKQSSGKFDYTNEIVINGKTEINIHQTKQISIGKDLPDKISEKVSTIIKGSLEEEEGEKVEKVKIDSKHKEKRPKSAKLSSSRIESARVVKEEIIDKTSEVKTQESIIKGVTEKGTSEIVEIKEDLVKTRTITDDRHSMTSEEVEEQKNLIVEAAIHEPPKHLVTTESQTEQELIGAMPEVKVELKRVEQVEEKTTDLMVTNNSTTQQFGTKEEVAQEVTVIEDSESKVDAEKTEKNEEVDVSIQSTETTEPTEHDEPTETTEPVEPTEPAKTTVSVEETETVAAIAEDQKNIQVVEEATTQDNIAESEKNVDEAVEEKEEEVTKTQLEVQEQERNEKMDDNQVIGNETSQENLDQTVEEKQTLDKEEIENSSKIEENVVEIHDKDSVLESQESKKSETLQKSKSKPKKTHHKKKRDVKSYEVIDSTFPVEQEADTVVKQKSITKEDSSLEANVEPQSSEDEAYSDTTTSSSSESKNHKSFRVLDDKEMKKEPRARRKLKQTPLKKQRSRSEEKSQKDKSNEREKLRRSKIPTPLNKNNLSTSDKYLNIPNDQKKSGIESRVPSLPNINESKDFKYHPRSESNMSAPLIPSAFSDHEKEIGSEDGEQEPDEDGQLRRRKLKKKFRKRNSKSAGSDYESSNIIDSGFEPSPRSSRIPRWKNMSERGVNMTSVTQSIQTNIRRYHLERKIFQHLLDLKRMQIRAGQHNEAVLVKRAIDTYHQSCASTVGAGRYNPQDFTFKSFEKFLYGALRQLQKDNAEYLKGLPESPVNPLHCTKSTHRCLHATHAYTGIPCAAYLPMMDHHTIPKIGFNSTQCKPGTGFLPSINPKKAVTLELCHGNDKQVISLPADKLDQNKRYYVTFTVKGDATPNDQSQILGHTHSKSD